MNRTTGEAKAAACRARWLKHPWKPFVAADVLKRMYSEKGMSQAEIATHFHVSLKAVQTAMRKFGIASRRPIKLMGKFAGNKSYQWKGRNAGYQAKHLRVQRLRGKPKKCEECGTTDQSKKYHWANLTGNYDDPNDFKRMCAKCHKRFDNARRNNQHP